MTTEKVIFAQLCSDRNVGIQVTKNQLNETNMLTLLNTYKLT